MKPTIETVLPIRIRTPQILKQRNWSLSTLHRRIKSGNFPSPRKDEGGRLNYWLVEDITNFSSAQ